jgi:hypothetical protein
MGLHPALLLTLAGGIVFLAAGAGFGWALLIHLSKPGQRAATWLFFFLLPAPAMAAGAALVLSAFVLSLRRTLLVAEPAKLIAVQSVLGLKHRREFTPARGVVLRLRQGSSDNLSLGILYVGLPNGIRRKVCSRYGAAEMRRLCDALQTMLATAPSDGPPPAGYLRRTHDDRGLSIHLGPEPMRQVLGGIFTVGLILAIGMPVFGSLLLTLVLLFPAPFEMKALIGAMLPLIVILFIILGLGACEWARRVARREADFLIDDDSLDIRITGPGDPLHFHWKRDEIASILVQPGNLSINNQPSQRLVITPHTGKAASMLNGRDIDDLAWLAETLREHLAIASATERRSRILNALSAPQRSEAGAARVTAIDTLLRGTNIERPRSHDRIVLHVAPLGWKRMPMPLFAFGCIFALGELLPLGALALPAAGGPVPVLPVIAFAILWLIAPALMFWTCYRAAFATASAEVSAREFLLRWDATFGRREIRLPCENISTVKAGWYSVGEDQEFVLQIHLRDGACRTAMNNFKQPELEKLAQALQLSLGLNV